LVRRPLFGLLYQSRMIDDECGAVGGLRLDRGNRSSRRKPAPVPLCSPQIPHNVGSNSGTAVGNQSVFLGFSNDARILPHMFISFPLDVAMLKLNIFCGLLYDV
jgi:hypothetical protein